ncbi:uncharacterized protein IL334_006573 [Kwoniella shivajii]|uniref:Uncharacterized protein n=1 Tax=Kwoniella shivajii TaxID=564305 RepID=A0ABZ1D7Z2_9TREE|nr:hypothetical protein IL334_006573 [Kwoniella shivajii]
MPRSRSRSRSRERERERDRKHHHRDRSRSRDRARERDRDRERRYKDRSASPSHERERDHKKSKKRETTPSDEEDGVDLRDMGVKEIDEEDYFLKSAEFKAWLKEEKGKYLDEMSSESAHKYFRKFVRRWNDGLLKPHQYHPAPPTAASENTGYKWSFASRTDSSLASIRADVIRSTHSSTRSASGPNPGSSIIVGPNYNPTSIAGPSRGPLGPSLPSTSDRQYASELAQDAKKAEKKSHLKDVYNRADELVPKSGGKEGKLEERRALNAENRKFRDKDVTAGLEVDEGTLMGEGGSFAAALKARELAEARRKDKKDFATQDRRSADSERLMERKAKESATMDMFKAMARERFG